MVICSVKTVQSHVTDAVGQQSVTVMNALRDISGITTTQEKGEFTLCNVEIHTKQLLKFLRLKIFAVSTCYGRAVKILSHESFAHVIVICGYARSTTKICF